MAHAAGQGSNTVIRDAMVAMRDGVRLATDAHLPAGDGPFPVVLERTPYGKAEPSRSEVPMGADAALSRAGVAAPFVEAGYAVVYQDCRGRYGSEGTFGKYVDEAADGADTLAWIRAQPWCDGRIATMGLSYAAHAQMALAALDPPGLAAQVIDSGGFSDSRRSGLRQGGAFELKQATWALKQARIAAENAGDSLRAAALKAEDPFAWFRRLPWRPGHSPLRWAPDDEAWLIDLWTRDVADPGWLRPGLAAEAHMDRYPRVPLVLMSSWYDPYALSTVENFAALRARIGPACRLVMGPWTHGDRVLTHAGDVDFGPEATFDAGFGMDFVSWRRRFLDHWVRGVANGADRDPAVRWFLMGGGPGDRDAAGRLRHGGEWRSAEAWPPPGTAIRRWHLHGDGRLDPGLPEAGAAPVAWDHDPDRPVPTIGGAIASGAPIMEAGAFDQVEAPRFYAAAEPWLPLAARPDVLVFQTAPLEREVVVAGPVAARLWVASDAPDTDLAIKLVDVHPPSAAWPRGFAMNVTDGVLRLRYRRGFDRPAWLAAGEVVEVTVEAFPTANLFKAGHRIRLDIASSNFPRFDVNPGTGEPEGRSRRRRVAANTLFLDRDRPSHLLLPVLEG